MSEPQIVLDEVSFQYGDILVLDRVSLCIDKGEFIGIVGPNGSGKSTLLKIILGLLKPQLGRVSLFGSLPEIGRIRIGYVPQFVPFSRNFPISVEQVVLLGRLGKTRKFGGFLASDRHAVRQTLEEVGIASLVDRPIASLSGGQLQKVMIARALVGQPEILLMDEPTANIDPHGEEGIFEFLKRLNSHVTVLVVSHDIAFVSRYVNRVACVNRKLVCHPSSTITPELIKELYGGDVHLVHHHHSVPHIHDHGRRKD